MGFRQLVKENEYSPAVNMITNVGFDSNATHTTGPVIWLTWRVIRSLPLTHPLGVFRNIQADQFSEHKCFRVPLMKRVLNQLAGAPMTRRFRGG